MYVYAYVCMYVCMYVCVLKRKIQITFAQSMSKSYNCKSFDMMYTIIIQNLKRLPH